jgi:sulfoacetaldehyde dehydrogenase
VILEAFDQIRVEAVVTAVARAIFEPFRASFLAKTPVRDSGLGRVADKVAKNQRKTIGTLRDQHGVPSVGVIGEHPERKITGYAKPLGLVAAICPATNPTETDQVRPGLGGPR